MNLREYYYCKRLERINKRLIMNSRDNIWVHQTRDYGLGNFINLTPTIKLMADHFDKPIPVYFDLEFIRDCFLDCPFIDILSQEPDCSPVFNSGLVNFRNDCPDYLHAYKEVTKRFPLMGDIPHTYVDTAKEVNAARVNTLFIRGSGSEHRGYLDSKMPYDEYYRELFAENLAGDYTEAFTGSANDIERANGLFDGMTKYTGGIRLTLALIREADYVVSNDSGLAHAAAAMNKNMTILWKNTSLPKNATPGKHTTYKMCH